MPPRLGVRTELVLRPKGTKPPVELQDDELRVRVSAEEMRGIPEVVAPRSSRPRRWSGHAYMVDVEPGRWRMRLKLPDGRDLTLEAASELATNSLKQAVDRVVEIEGVEELEGDQITARTIASLSLLPSSGPGSSRPPKSVDELAREQGLADSRPDYPELATAVLGDGWEQRSDFDEYLRQIRQEATSRWIERHRHWTNISWRILQSFQG